MTTPQLPFDQNNITTHISSASNSSQIQQLPASETYTMLQREDTNGFIKKLILGYYVYKTIKQNEEKQVRTGVEIVDLQSNKTLVKHNLDDKHFAASVNKLPVVMLVLQDVRNGELSLDQTMTWSASDVRAGAGVYDQPGAPLQATLRDVVYDLLHRSGNTAVRVLVNYGLGGAAAVNQRWSEIPQLSNTRLQPLDANRFYLGDSTVRDSLWTMRELMKTRDSYTAFIKDAMKNNIYDDMGVRSQLAGNDYITLVNKVGILDDVEGDNRHDVGIIYNTRTRKSYGYSFFTTSPYDNAEATPQADQSLKEMGRYTLRYSGDKKHHEQLDTRTERLLQSEKRILY
jgi:beta-lactamase class A